MLCWCQWKTSLKSLRLRNLLDQFSNVVCLSLQVCFSFNFCASLNVSLLDFASGLMGLGLSLALSIEGLLYLWFNRPHNHNIVHVHYNLMGCCCSQTPILSQGLTDRKTWTWKSFTKTKNKYLESNITVSVCFEW